MEKIVIIGVGGFGRETAFVIEEINKQNRSWNLLGFIDEEKTKHGELINHYPVLGDLDWLKSNPNTSVVCSISNNQVKHRIVCALKPYNIRFPNIIHPNVIYYSENSFGIGNIISPGNILNIDIHVGNHICFEMGSTFGHDVIIEDFVSIMPGVNVAGNVFLGEGCYLGTGCTIIQGKRIGKWATVGAGAVVIEDVPAYSTVVGVPAKVIKTHPPIKVD